MHAIDIAEGDSTHRLVLRRWARTDFGPDPGVVENERAALVLLTGTASLAAPRFVAADPDAVVADVPALLMTRLPGAPRLAPADIDRWLDDLVTTLHAVHDQPLPSGALGEYQPWTSDYEEPPEWTSNPGAWRALIDAAHEPAPATARGLCHRDFWPGNVLWRRDRVSGIVDWTHACRGPAAVDVAHCGANIAWLFGVDAADEFARRYGTVEELSRFQLLEVAGWGLEPADVWRWHDAGRTDLSFALMTERVDEFVTRAARRAG
jgi:aminoglycoside phosphotransferase (APT) family kinase protein